MPGPVATPSAPVVPLQWMLLSRLTIDTFAPATGAALSRRVTNTSVFCGLSLTVTPRFVTWTSDARAGCTRALGVLNRRAVLDRRPDEAGAARAERLRDVEAVRLNAIVGHAELAVHGIDRRPDAERRRQRANRRHQVVGLRAAPPTASRRRDCASRTAARDAAARFPHAVAVAEAREGRAVPVLDLARPRCSRASDRRRRQAGVNRDEVRARGRLRARSRASSSVSDPLTRRCPTTSSGPAGGGPAARPCPRPS